MRAIAASVLVLAACGPTWSRPGSPAYACPTITQAEYEQAIAAGAARATARIHTNGVVDLQSGPGVQHCATYSSTPRVCRRPVDYVIAYTTAEDDQIYVRVPANAEFRFDVHNRPHTCEILANS